MSISFSCPSAAAHAGATDATGLLDPGWSLAAGISGDWDQYLQAGDYHRELEQCTYAGRPWGDVAFVKQMAERFGRQWTRGRPKKEAAARVTLDGQIDLFAG
jgi:hypothetical protein